MAVWDRMERRGFLESVEGKEEEKQIHQREHREQKCVASVRYGRGEGGKENGK